MECDTGECDCSWHYANPLRTLEGALQRGLGRGAARAPHDPDGPDLVTERLRRDERWDWSVDERAVYLARLVRDMRLGTAPIAAQLMDAPPAHADDDNVFDLAAGVLAALGDAGIREAIDAVRDCVREGPRVCDVLAVISESRNVESWDDLRPLVRDRLRAEGEQRLSGRSPLWRHWAAQDEVIAEWVRSGSENRPKAPRPFADRPLKDLLWLLCHGDREERRRAGCELRHRPPQPEILDIVDDLPEEGPFLGHQMRRLGAQALPAARRWAGTPEHRYRWTGYDIIAAHGDDGDAPMLLDALDWLDSRPADRCGYDVIAEGLARIGGQVAVAALPRLRRLWFSPHSYERSAYLRAFIALEPERVRLLLVEGLWDCESDVRELAARHVELNDVSGERLHYLRDDPMETAEVRAVAQARLGRPSLTGCGRHVAGSHSCTCLK